MDRNSLRRVKRWVTFNSKWSSPTPKISHSSRLFLWPCSFQYYYFFQVKVGDILDLVLSENKETKTVTLMRVIPRRVYGESSISEKHKVTIRRWKFLELPMEEAFKPWASIGPHGQQCLQTVRQQLWHNWRLSDNLKALWTSWIWKGSMWTSVCEAVAVEKCLSVYLSSHQTVRRQ